MAFLIKGILLEYGGNLLGPLPNVVLFQFNPEALTRQIQIPQRPSGSRSSESNQSGEKPLENISFKAYFSSADYVNEKNPISIAFGVGPQLAALEKMVHPSAGTLLDNLKGAIDQIGSLIGSNAGDAIVNPIPREIYPKILFIWGPARVLPVVITSMTINEKHYDRMLNPVEAEVSLSLTLKEVGPCSNDDIAKGAFVYSNLMKDTQAAANMANLAVEPIMEIIKF